MAQSEAAPPITPIGEARAIKWPKRKPPLPPHRLGKLKTPCMKPQRKETEGDGGNQRVEAGGGQIRKKGGAKQGIRKKEGREGERGKKKKMGRERERERCLGGGGRGASPPSGGDRLLLLGLEKIRERSSQRVESVL